MDSFEMMVRQVILYSLPLLITSTVVPAVEHHFLQKKAANIPFNLLWHGAWLPFTLSIVFGRAIIFALPYPHSTGIYAATIRFLAHIFLCALGYLLYTWALSHPPVSGLPPLHHWWAKILMYMNLCLLALHLLPLPNMLVGEWLLRLPMLKTFEPWVRVNSHVFIILIIFFAATPLLDIFLGNSVIFPVYELLASMAT